MNAVVEIVVGISASVVGVCSLSSSEDVSTRVIPSIFNIIIIIIIIIIRLILIVGKNQIYMQAG